MKTMKTNTSKCNSTTESRITTINNKEEPGRPAMRHVNNRLLQIM